MRRSTIAALALSAFVATTIAPVTSHAQTRTAEDAPSSRGWAHVAIDTSAVGEAGPVLRRRVQERADVVLRRAGVMPGRSPQDPTINVVIKEITGDDPSWEHTIGVTRGDTVVMAPEMQTCPLCTETELVEAVEGRLSTIAGKLEEDAKTLPPSDASTDPTTDAAEPEPKTTPVTTDDTRKGKLGTKGKAGVALVALGAAGVIAGVVLIVLPDRPKSGDPTREVFTQPPGYGVLAGGAVSLVVGAVLLGLDRKQAKKQGRKQARIRLGAGGVLHF
jgi:hypothetical protein